MAGRPRTRARRERERQEQLERERQVIEQATKREPLKIRKNKREQKPLRETPQTERTCARCGEPAGMRRFAFVEVLGDQRQRLVHHPDDLCGGRGEYRPR